jgi:Protein of unknown function (DUF2842)
MRGFGPSNRDGNALRLNIMKIRHRKLIGIASTVIVMIVYALVAMAIGGKYVVGLGTFVELPAFIILGLGWMPIVMVLVRWMSRPDA